MDPMGLNLETIRSLSFEVNPFHSKTRVLRSGGGGNVPSPRYIRCVQVWVFFNVFWISRQRKIADSTWYLEWNLFPIFLFRPLDVPKLFALHAEQQTCPCYSVTSMPWRHGHPNVFQAAHDFSKKWKFADLMFIDFGRRLEHWYILDLGNISCHWSWNQWIL